RFARDHKFNSNITPALPAIVDWLSKDSEADISVFIHGINHHGLLPVPALQVTKHLNVLITESSFTQLGIWLIALQLGGCQLLIRNGPLSVGCWLLLCLFRATCNCNRQRNEEYQHQSPAHSLLGTQFLYDGAKV